MSSTNKTPNLRLNSWVGTDVPCREDFVRDNQLIDSALNNHSQNRFLHVTPGERDKWNNNTYLQTYNGNGSSYQIVNLNCPFTPRWGYVYARYYPTSCIDVNNNAHYHYFGFFNIGVESTGLVLNGKKLTVKNELCRFFDSELYNFNERGVDYEIVIYR